MAATRIVSGVLREIWHDGAHVGGAPQVFMTGIPISAQQLNRIRGLLIVEAATGPATPGCLLAVVNGHLQVTITHGNAAVTLSWTLDLQITHSIQQATDFDPAHVPYVAIVFGVAATMQTLSQTYAIGLSRSDQTMVLANANNPTTVGIILDGSTAAVTSDGAALEVRQNALHAIPVVISRCIGGQNPGPNLQFTRARGTYDTPVNIAVDDELGTIDFYGYMVAGFGLMNRIVAITTAIAAGPTATTAFDFYTTLAGSRARVLRVDGAANLCVATSVAGGGAAQTLLLPNTATLPAAQANQVYIGSVDFSGVSGSSLAVVAIAAEEPTIPIGVKVADTLVPMRYNGKNLYLLAVDDNPA